MGLKYGAVGPMIVDDQTGVLLGYRDEHGVDRYLDGRVMQGSESGGGHPVSNETLRGARSRCATRLYSTALSNTTSAALVGYGFPGPTKVTHALIAETEVEFDAVSLIVQNTSGAALTWGNLKASSVREVPAFNTKITESLSGKFSGAASIAVAAGSVTSPTFAISDPIPLGSVPRTDGGPRPLVLFTVETTTATDGSTQIGSHYRGAGNDATLTHDGGRVIGVLTLAGPVAPAGLPAAAATTGASSAIVGFVYWSRGAKVLTVMESGNSIVAGNTLTVANRGHLIRAVEAVSTKDEPIEYMVAGLPGQGIETIRALTEKIMAQADAATGLLPGVLFWNAFDTNANVGGAISPGPMRAATARVDARAQKTQTHLVLVDGLPRQSDATTSAWSNDVLRREFNANLSADFQADVIKQGAALQSATNPALFASGTVQGDLTHPTDAGDDLVKGLLVEYLKGTS